MINRQNAIHIFLREVQGREGECCGMGRRQSGEFESEEGWKGGGLVVGWGGCECDGLVSITLSLSMSAASTHPSMVSHSPVCVKAMVFLSLQSVFVLLCCSTFTPFFVQSHSHWQLSSRCCIHNELCLYLVCWCVAWWSVGCGWCSVFHCPLPKKKRQHSTRPCLHVMACTNASCCMVWWVSESVCCGVVVWWVQGGKKGRGKHTVKQKTKRTFPKNHFFPFPFFPPLFHPLFPPCLPLFHHHSLLIHKLTCFSFFTHECIHGEPKTPLTQHPIHFIVFSICPNSLFLFFLSVDDSSWCNHNQILSNNQITFI